MNIYSQLLNTADIGRKYAERKHGLIVNRDGIVQEVICHRVKENMKPIRGIIELFDEDAYCGVCRLNIQSLLNLTKL